jgi:hypothetical protein
MKGVKHMLALVASLQSLEVSLSKGWKDVSMRMCYVVVSGSQALWGLPEAQFRFNQIGIWIVMFSHKERLRKRATHYVYWFIWIGEL